MPPPQTLNLQGLVLLGMPNCQQCDVAARWLEDNNVAYTKYDVSTSPNTVAWLVNEVGVRNVPQFFYNGQHIPGGFAQVQQLGAAGELPKPGASRMR